MRFYLKFKPTACSVTHTDTQMLMISLLNVLLQMIDEGCLLLPTMNFILLTEAKVGLEAWIRPSFIYSL